LRSFTIIWCCISTAFISICSSNDVYLYSRNVLLSILFKIHFLLADYLWVLLEIKVLHFMALPITKITFVCGKWMKYDYGKLVPRYWWENPDVLGEKPALEPRCSPQIPHGLTLVSKSIFRGEWPASKRRNHGTAVKVCDYKIPRHHILQRLQT